MKSSIVNYSNIEFYLLSFVIQRSSQNLLGLMYLLKELLKHVKQYSKICIKAKLIMPSYPYLTLVGTFPANSIVWYVFSLNVLCI